MAGVRGWPPRGRAPRWIGGARALDRLPDGAEIIDRMSPRHPSESWLDGAALPARCHYGRPACSDPTVFLEQGRKGPVLDRSPDNSAKCFLERDETLLEGISLVRLG